MGEQMTAEAIAEYEKMARWLASGKVNHLRPVDMVQIGEMMLGMLGEEDVAEFDIAEWGLTVREVYEAVVNWAKETPPPAPPRAQGGEQKSPPFRTVPVTPQYPIAGKLSEERLAEIEGRIRSGMDDDFINPAEVADLKMMNDLMGHIGALEEELYPMRMVPMQTVKSRDWVYLIIQGIGADEWPELSIIGYYSEQQAREAMGRMMQRADDEDSFVFQRVTVE